MTNSCKCNMTILYLMSPYKDVLLTSLTKCNRNHVYQFCKILKIYSSRKRIMMLLYRPVKKITKKKFTLILLYFVVSQTILKQHFLPTGPKKRMESIFSRNQIFHHISLKLFSGIKNIYQ